MVEVQTPSNWVGNVILYLGVNPKIGGKKPKWMVDNGKPYEQMDDLGIPLYLETSI